MGIGKRLVIVSTCVFILGFLLNAFFVYQGARERSVNALLQQAERIRGTLMSTRRIYHRQFLSSGIDLTDKTLGFLPAHAMSNISKDFQNWDESGLRFNNVSERPRNPNNKADNEEMKAITYFKENRDESLFFRPYEDANGVPFYLYAKPIWVEGYCLKCHGLMKNAPPTIKANYTTAYNYKVGELRGILSINLPASNIDTLAMEEFRREAAFLFLIFTSIFFVILYMVRKHVTAPLLKLKDGIEGIASGEFESKLSGFYGELAPLERSFNSMASQLKSSFQTIKDNENLFKMMTDTSPLAIYMSSGIEQNASYINNTFVKFFGYTLEDVPSVAEWWPRAYPDEKYRKSIEKEWQKLAAEAIKTRSKIIPMETTVTCKDGTHKRISWGFMSIGEQNWAFGMDLTDRRDAERQLIAAKDEAEKANTAKSEFLASMSHDLRTPLNAIIGFSEMMKIKTFGPLGDDHYDQYAADIHDSGSLLISLINDVLDLSKIEAGKYELVEEPLEISELTKTSFRQLEMMADASDQTLSSNVPSDMPHLRGDERALIQLFNNLVSNAIKFTPRGGKITVTAKVSDDNRIVIKFSDTGIGMTKSSITKALQPFEQADGTHSRRHKGTGLGLHLCVNFMQLFGGTLEVESKVDKGTTVTICFPAERTIFA